MFGWFKRFREEMREASAAEERRVGFDTTAGDLLRGVPTDYIEFEYEGDTSALAQGAFAAVAKWKKVTGDYDAEQTEGA